MPKVMETSQKQTSLFTEDKSTSLQGDSLVNPIHKPENDEERRTTDTSGRKCLEQFERFNQPGLWAKTFAALLIGTGDWYSTKCRLTWKLKGTKSNRFYFQLAPSTLPTEGIESGLLLSTPSANPPGNITPERAKELGWKWSGTSWIIPDGRKVQTALNHRVMLLPTPKATEIEEDYDKWRERMKNSKSPKNHGKTIPNIGTMAVNGLLPTPTATSDVKGGCTMPDKKRQNDTLAYSIHGMIGEPGKTSQLNPRFVAEMMGFPPNWTELPLLNGETNQSKPTETQ